jgi:hypothetical protein
VAALVALYDASVLYPAPLRDLLMRLALTGLFRARWTDKIHEEWMRSLLADRSDLRAEQLERTRDLMNAAVLDCLVTGYEETIESLTLPDADDRHVLAAAIVGQAGVIVTLNLKDFPPKALQPYGIEPQHPDEFIDRLFELDPDAVFAAVKEQRQSLKKPPKSVDEFLALAAFAGLPKTLARLRTAAADRI